MAPAALDAVPAADEFVTPSSAALLGAEVAAVTEVDAVARKQRCMVSQTALQEENKNLDKCPLSSPTVDLESVAEALVTLALGSAALVDVVASVALEAADAGGAADAEEVGTVLWLEEAGVDVSGLEVDSGVADEGEGVAEEIAVDVIELAVGLEVAELVALELALGSAVEDEDSVVELEAVLAALACVVLALLVLLVVTLLSVLV